MKIRTKRMLSSWATALVLLGFLLMFGGAMSRDAPFTLWTLAATAVFIVPAWVWAE